MPDDRRVVVLGGGASVGAGPLRLLATVRAVAARGCVVDLVLRSGGPLLPEMRRAATTTTVVDDDLQAWWPATTMRRLGAEGPAGRAKGVRLRRHLDHLARRASLVHVHGEAAAGLAAHLTVDLPVTALLGQDESLPVGVSAADVAALRARAVRTVVTTPDGVVGGGERLPVGGWADAGAVRAELGIPAGATLVSAAGSDDPWLRPDPVVPLLRALQARLGDVHLLWAAVDPHDAALAPLRHEVDQADLGPSSHVVGLDLLGAGEVQVLLTRSSEIVRLTGAVQVAGRPLVWGDPGVAEPLVGTVVGYRDVVAAAAAAADLLPVERSACVAGLLATHVLEAAR